MSRTNRPFFMLTHTNPIILIDSDTDDQHLYRMALKELAPNMPLLCFNSGQPILDYLRTTTDRPFLILAEIRNHPIDGIELRREIEADPLLRKKAIPFVFLTYPTQQQQVEEAYELTIQGFFEKALTMEALREQLRIVLLYWQHCKHPNAFINR